MSEWPILQKQYFSKLLDEPRFQRWSQGYIDLRLAPLGERGMRRRVQTDRWLFREALGVQDEGGHVLREQVVIVGDAGAGKSTASQRATWELAREGLARSDSPEVPVTPVYFELDAYRHVRDLARSERMLEHLAATMRKDFLRGQEFSARQLERSMDCGPFLFFLDGLNEVRPDERAELIKDLKSFMAEFSGWGHQFVITTRKFDYEHQFASHFPTDTFELLEILTLDRASINKFISDKLRQSEAAETLLKLLHRPEYERVLWLAQNPGTLSDLVTVYQDSQKIPLARFLIIESAIQARLDLQAQNPFFEFEQETKFKALQAMAVS